MSAASRCRPFTIVHGSRAHLNAATARRLGLIREFDARGPRSRRSAGARPRARALGGLPLINRALADGEISYSKARGITRVATATPEARLLAVAKAGTATHASASSAAW